MSMVAIPVYPAKRTCRVPAQSPREAGDFGLFARASLVATVMSDRPRQRRTAITGIGLSAVGRRLNRDGLDLALEASLAAIADAGLQRADIDGLSCWPGRVVDMPGASPVSTWEVKDALGLSLNWYAGGMEGPAQM